MSKALLGTDGRDGRKNSKSRPIRSLRLGKDGDSSQNIFVSRSEPCREESLGPHIHHFYELVFVEEGNGSHSVDSAQLNASKGDLFWISPGEIHDPHGLHLLTKWTLAFQADLIVPGHAGWAPATGQYSDVRLRPFALPLAEQTRRLHIAKEEQAAFTMRLDQIRREIKSQEPGHEHVARALLELILVDIARRSITTANEEDTKPNGLVNDVLQFIDEHFRRPIGLRDAAKAVGRSPAYITDLVRRRTGRPVLQWLAERRIAEARRLLLSTPEMSIEEIADAVGYLNASHFCRQFRARAGMPPTAFRASHKR